MPADEITRKKVLELIPQQTPFRFVDEILELDEDCIRGGYTFKENEFFYKGHFPGNPITPGVVLIEAMAQIGAVGHGIYHMMLKGALEDEIKQSITLFSLADEIEFLGLVPPGARVEATGEKVYFRRGNFKTRVRMTMEGRTVCSGLLTGTEVKFNG